MPHAIDSRDQCQRFQGNVSINTRVEVTWINFAFLSLTNYDRLTRIHAELTTKFYAMRDTKMFVCV